MKTARELFPDCNKDGFFSGPYSYSSFLGEFGRIVVKVDDADYQGDTYERLSRALGLQALNESLRHLANYEEHR